MLVLQYIETEVWEKRGSLVLQILHYAFAALGMLFAIYGLVTKDFQFQYIMMLFLGLMFVTMSVKEFREKRKMLSLLLFIVAFFAFFVTIQSFLLRS